MWLIAARKSTADLPVGCSVDLPVHAHSTLSGKLSYARIHSGSPDAIEARTASISSSRVA
jgi:hypothetical protein